MSKDHHRHHHREHEHHKHRHHDGRDDDNRHGGRGDDHLKGHRGDDRLDGRDGDDTLKGGSGDDHLIGGGGHDVLRGGSGHDHFDFKSLADSVPGAQHDFISDFHHGDKIDLHRIDAEVGPGNQHFDWIGDDVFHNKPGELRYEQQGKNMLVQADQNGDGIADFEVLVHAHALHAHDFVL